MSHTDISWAKVRALPHQNLTPGLLNWQRQDTLVDLQRNLERVMVPGSLQFASAPQRLPVKTACCNCSTCWNRRMGSRACATAVSSCCCCADRTPENRRRLGLFSNQAAITDHLPHNRAIFLVK